MGAAEETEGEGQKKVVECVCEAARWVGAAAEEAEFRKLYTGRTAGSGYSKAGITGSPARKKKKKRARKSAKRVSRRESMGTDIQSISFAVLILRCGNGAVPGGESRC
jgi:hypothetical protein